MYQVLYIWQILTLYYFFTINFLKFIHEINEVTSILKDDLFDSFTNFDDIFKVQLILFVHFFVYFKYFVPSIQDDNIFFIVKDCISYVKGNVKQSLKPTFQRAFHAPSVISAIVNSIQKAIILVPNKLFDFFSNWKTF